MLRWLSRTCGPRTGTDDRRGGETSPGAPGRGPERPRYVGKAHFDLSLAAPDWFDDDVLARLLADRPLGSGVVTAARLVAQPHAGLVVPPRSRPAIIQLAVLLHPQEVLRLRSAARGAIAGERASTGRGAQRRAVDRRFTDDVAAQHAAIRQLAYDWLLAHGCDRLEPARKG
jgi:hypothetical protein